MCQYVMVDLSTFATMFSRTIPDRVKFSLIINVISIVKMV